MPLRFPVDFERPVPVTMAETLDKTKISSRLLYRRGRIAGNFLQVPQGSSWYVRHIAAKYVTDATVGNRFPVFWIWRPDEHGDVQSDGRMLTLYQTHIWTQVASRTAFMFAGPNESNQDEATQWDNQFVAHRTLPNIPYLSGDYFWYFLDDALGTDYIDITMIVDEVTV